MVNKIQQCVTRDPTFFCQHCYFCKALRYNAQQNVVADLDHTCQLAAAHISRAFTNHIQVLLSQRKGRLGT